MADEDDKSSKTEEPSEKKLKKARDKGDLPISKEVGSVLGYISMLSLVALFLPGSVPDMTVSLSHMFRAAPFADVSTGATGLRDLIDVASPLIASTVLFLAGAMGIFFVISLCVSVLQGPLVFSSERIMPKLNKISPMKGFKKLVSANNLFEFTKNLVKMTILSSLTLWLAWAFLDKTLPGGVLLVEFIPGLVAAQAKNMLVWICALMIPVLIADYAWVRYSYNRKQMMTMKEVRDEHKDSEGDPHIRGKRDQIRRKMSRQRLAMDVPTATLILTNPTHYAVALRYVRGVDPAPVCVAKGADLIAAKIREIAHDNEIPVIESRALARALFAVAEVGDPIPEAHWASVAEVVGFVFDLQRKVRRKPPEGASIRLD